MKASLRTKGILAVMVLIGYLAFISVFLAHQRQNLLLIVDHMETTQVHQAVLAPIVSMLAHSIVETHVLLHSAEQAPGRADSYGDLPDEFESIGSGLAEAQKLYPELEPYVREFGMATASLRASRGGQDLKQLDGLEQSAMAALSKLTNELDARSKELTQRYRDTQQYISVFAIAANVVGAIASIAVIIVFFTRLAKDIKRLQDRAVAIVGGYSGEPLRNTRKDEVGGLIDAVNRMQGDLRRWEQRLEIERQQRSHHEKMAAVGSLAAAIAHEVSNPIAAIAGVAQFIVDETKREDQRSNKTVNEFAAQILSQTERIALIMRKMATLTAPHPPEAEMLDLNALIQSTCGFIGYDNRFRGIEFEYHLDHERAGRHRRGRPPHAGADESAHQRGGCDGSRQGTGSPQDPDRDPYGGRRRAGVGERQRPRHDPGGHGQGVRRILHDQGCGRWTGHRIVRLQVADRGGAAAASCCSRPSTRGRRSTCSCRCALP